MGAEDAMPCKNFPVLTKAILCLVFLVAMETHTAILRVNRLGGEAFSTLGAAILAAQNGDTILLAGTTGELYLENWPVASTRANLTIMGETQNPNQFPRLRILNWMGWDSAYSGVTHFERVVMENSVTINLSHPGRFWQFNRVIFRSYVASVFNVFGRNENGLIIHNSIFRNNNTVFNHVATMANAGGQVYNSNFSWNNTVSNHNPTSADVSAGRILSIHNSIFFNNTVIAPSTILKSAWTFNLVPFGESGWGTGTIFTGSPGFVNSSGSFANARDFTLASNSLARDAGGAGGATPRQDLNGNPRPGGVQNDIGAFEFADYPLRLRRIYPVAGAGETSHLFAFLAMEFNHPISVLGGNLILRRASDNLVVENIALNAPRIEMVQDSLLHDFELMTEWLNIVDTRVERSARHKLSGAYSLEINSQASGVAGVDFGAQDWTAYDSLVAFVRTEHLTTSQMSMLIYSGATNLQPSNLVRNVEGGRWTRVSVPLAGVPRRNEVWRLGMQFSLEGVYFVDNVHLVRRDLHSVRIPISTTLTENTKYFVTVSSGTIANAWSETFAGISDSTEWTFYTGGHTYYWDISDSHGIQGGGGVWGSSWSWSSQGTQIRSWPGAGNHAVFGGEDGDWNIYVSQIQNASSLRFINSGYALNYGGIVLENQGSIGVDSGKVASIYSELQGNFRKTGAGMLRVASPNVRSGNLGVEAGTLIFSGSPYSVGLPEGMHIRIQNQATVRLQENHILVPGTQVQIDFGGTLNMENFEQNLVSITGGGRVINIPDQLKLSPIGGNTIFFGGSFQGTGGINISGDSAVSEPAIIELAGASTYTGTTIIGGGSRDYGRSILRLSSGNNRLPEGGDIQFGNPGFYNLWPTLILGDSLRGPVSQRIGNITDYSLGIARILGGAASSSTLEVEPDEDAVFYGELGGSGVYASNLSLVKLGPATLTLKGVSFYSGGTRVVQGRILAGSNHALGTGPVEIMSEAGQILLDLNIFPSNALILNGCQTNPGQGLLHAYEDAGWFGEITINQSCPETVHFSTQGNLRFGGSINSRGNAIPTQGGNGSVFYSGGGNATGFILLGGNAIISNDNGLPVSAHWQQPGLNDSSVLNLMGYSQRFAGISSPSNPRAIITNSQTRISELELVVPWEQPASFGGNIVGPISLIKMGNGEQVLAGNLQDLQGVSIRHGTLTLGNGGERGDIGNVPIFNQGILRFNRSGSYQVFNYIGGNGEVHVLGGTANFFGRHESTGVLRIMTGASVILSGDSANAPFTSVVCDGSLSFNQGVDQVFSGVIHGTGSLYKSNSSVFTLTEDSRFSGTTNILGGTLRLGNGGNSGSVAGPIQFGHSGVPVLRWERSDNGTIFQTITGINAQARVEKAGMGTLTLSGGNTFTGSLHILSGTLIVSGSIGQAEPVIVERGAILGGGGFVAGAVSVKPGAILQAGQMFGGSLTLGELRMDTGSVLQVALTRDYSKIQVNGHLGLHGRLALTLANNLTTGVYTLLSATGEISLNDLVLENLPAGFRGSLQLNGGEVQLRLETTLQDMSVLPTVAVAGQAVRISWSPERFAVHHGSTRRVRLRSSIIDTTFFMPDSLLMIYPLNPGNYTLEFGSVYAWNYVRISDLSFQVLPAQIILPGNTWLMQGFGLSELPWQVLGYQSQIFVWDDYRFPDPLLGQYQLINRSGVSVPGQGYWYWSDRDDTLNINNQIQQLTPVILDAKVGTTGWNMISNPYPWPVAAKIALDGILQENVVFHRWVPEQADYEPVTSLEPFTAAWVHLNSGHSIYLPSEPQWNSAALGKEIASGIQSEAQWNLRLSLRSGPRTDANNFIGVDSGIDLEKLSWKKPPGRMGDHVQLSLGSLGESKSRDLRLYTLPDTWLWEIRLSASSPRQGELIIEGIADLLNAGYRVQLQAGNGKQLSITDAKPIPLSLSAIPQKAVLQIIPPNTNFQTRESGTLMVYNQANSWKIQTNVELVWNGAPVFLEILDLQGQRISLQELASARAGLQTWEVKNMGLALRPVILRLRIGNHISVNGLAFPFPTKDDVNF